MIVRFIGVLFILYSHLAVAEGLEFNQGWSRATVPGAQSAAIYGRLENTGDKDLSLQEITSEVAGMLMIHRSVLENDMMKMHHVGNLLIHPGETVVFEPGGLHIMLSGLKKALAEGDSFDIKIGETDGDYFVAKIIVGSIGQMNAPY